MPCGAARKRKEYLPMYNIYVLCNRNMGKYWYHHKMNFTTFCYSFGHCCMAHGILLPIQFSSVAQSCPTLCDSMNRSTRGLPVHHQLPESTQTHVYRVNDAIQLSHPLSSPSPPALNLFHHQGLFQWVSSSHQVAKVLEFQLHHESYQWTPKTGLL